MENEKWKKYMANIDPRVDALRGSGYSIEAFLLEIAAMEIFLDELLEEVVVGLNELAQNGDWGITIDLRALLKTRQYLGDKKELLLALTGDKALCDELQFFIGLRNDYVHKLLDKNIEALETTVTTNSKRFNEMMITLLSKINNLLSKSIELRKKMLPRVPNPVE